MFDLTEELHGLVQLYQNRADRNRGAVLAFVGVNGSAGTSTCARAFSRLVAPNSRRGVWLFDLDFYANEQYATFATPQASQIYGQIGTALDSSLNTKPFWRVSPLLVRKNGQKSSPSWYMSLHQIGSHRLFVSRFRAEKMKSGQSVHVTRAPDYWQRVRDAIDLAILDIPARDRARSVLAMAADMDGIVLVAEPETDPNKIVHLQREIEAAGGTCLGLVYNTKRVVADDPHWNVGR